MPVAMVSSTHSVQPPEGSYIGKAEVRNLIARMCPADTYRGNKVLLLVPDATRTCPLGMFFAGLFDQIAPVSSAFDVMIALGTHPPMSAALATVRSASTTTPGIIPVSCGR